MNKKIDKQPELWDFVILTEGNQIGSKGVITAILDPGPFGINYIVSTEAFPYGEMVNDFEFDVVYPTTEDVILKDNIIKAKNQVILETGGYAVPKGEDPWTYYHSMARIAPHYEKDTGIDPKFTIVMNTNTSNVPHVQLMFKELDSHGRKVAYVCLAEAEFLKDLTSREMNDKDKQMLQDMLEYSYTNDNGVRQTAWLHAVHMWERAVYPDNNKYKAFNDSMRRNPLSGEYQMPDYTELD